MAEADRPRSGAFTTGGSEHVMLSVPCKSRSKVAVWECGVKLALPLLCTATRCRRC